MNRTRALWLVVLTCLAALCALSMGIGAREVGWADVIAALGGHVDSIGQAAVTVRIPRTLLALLAGAALGLAGAVMQGVTRNPLADPGILGVNMGASLAVVIGVAWFNIASAYAYVWAAILGAGSSAVFVYIVGSLGRGGATPLKLALSGAATSIAFSSMVVAVVLPRNDIAGGIHAWQIGGVGGATFDGISHVLPFLAMGFAVSLLCARKLNSLALGDELAAGLGERVALARAIAALGAILLCGATTAICGPIGFLGLVVSHLCRLLVGVDHRWLLPFSAFCGASLLLAADIVGRIVARPAELDVGIVTAFVGAPFFIWIVRRQRVRELWRRLFPSSIPSPAAGAAARRHHTLIAILLVLLAAVFVLTLSLGQSFTPPGEVIRVLLGENVPGASFTVGQLRLPRAVLAVLAGLSFGLGGVAFQIMLRNPLASPDIIGISWGASAAAVFAIVVLSLNGPLVSIFAVAAGLGVALLVYALSFRNGVAGTRLILVGIGVSAMLESFVAYILSRAPAWNFKRRYGG